MIRIFDSFADDVKMVAILGFWLFPQEHADAILQCRQIVVFIWKFLRL